MHKGEDAKEDRRVEKRKMLRRVGGAGMRAAHVWVVEGKKAWHGRGGRNGGKEGGR